MVRALFVFARLERTSMPRLGLLMCALALSGCNAVLPGASAPEASVPAATMDAPSPDQIGAVVAPPLADLDCAPRAGAITCN
ncbi:MAG: hypothetical protein JWO64_1701 [Hyphomicrobiales bacterium]|jgi:hypothetical protein|nr:hypothetical protein [Hyphomicrobiales bacterium]